MASTALSGYSAPLRLNAMPIGSRTKRSVLPVVRAAAAKLPQGVIAPREEPKLPVALWGFTRTAEVWNSRAAMIGIFGIAIVEFLIGRGLLQTAGVDVGKGLNLPF